MRTELPGSRPATGARAYVRRALLTGLALTVPLLVTLFVLFFALDLLAGALDPFVLALEGIFGFTGPVSRLTLQVSAVGALVVIIFLVGATAESQYGSGRIEPRVEALISSIPGLGSVYESLNEMSKILLSRDSDSFQEVKLVEYPSEGSYTIAFLTAEPGEAVRNATSHQEMVSLFLPMAPNPFMGGFVIHVAADRVYDVDMTVEEGIQAIVSSGVAVDEHADGVEGRQSGPEDLGIDGHSRDRRSSGDADTGNHPGPGGRL
ncbi:MAG: DUF502 domain-containing protein [Haloarculaceae archaeon]